MDVDFWWQKSGVTNIEPLTNEISLIWLRWRALTIGINLLSIRDIATMAFFFGYFIIPTIKGPTVSNHIVDTIGFGITLVTTITLIFIIFTQCKAETQHRNQIRLKWFNEIFWGSYHLGQNKSYYMIHIIWSVLKITFIFTKIFLWKLTVQTGDLL